MPKNDPTADAVYEGIRRANRSANKTALIVLAVATVVILGLSVWFVSMF